MNRAKVFENMDSRRLFAIFAMLSVLFLFVVGMISFYSMSNIQTHLMEREYVITGRLIESGVDEQKVIAAFATKDSTRYNKAGERALKTAGYNENTADVILPFLYGDTVGSFLVIFIAALTIAVLFMLFSYFTLKRIYYQIAQAGETAVLISRGNYGAKLKEDAEGAFARMNHAFNEMSAGVQAGFEQQKKQRVFLKNLISDISHQLKTPLAALKMYNEIILQETVSGTVLDFTQKSQEQLDRMEWLILGLLKMARVEAGCLEFELQRSSLKTVAFGAAQDFSMPMKEKEITLVLECGAQRETPQVLCDPDWLREAIGNVVKNCVEYTPQGGQITVTITQTPVMASVTVRDTGKGIHPDDLPFIFRRFYRGRSSKSPGSGIGLSLAKSIVEQMDGTLTAGGEYGRGAVFTFSFLKQVI